MKKLLNKKKVVEDYKKYEELIREVKGEVKVSDILYFIVDLINKK